MALRPLKSFYPTADELLAADLQQLGPDLLVHLNSYEDRVKQHAGLNQGYFRAMLENRNVGLGPLPEEPEYGARQPEVTKRMMEAWNWLERQGLLISNGVDGWLIISSAGEELIQRKALHEQLERYGLDRVKSELGKDRPRIGTFGGRAKDISWAWEWLRMKENKPPRKPIIAGEWVLIAESRLGELRALTSPQFDFRKLVRLCEELNVASREECYFATAMLTRSVLDHVPPIFGKKNFDEVANNYGTKSFKGAMQHLQNASRNVADGHLHQQIRKSETLPTVQQVHCGQQLDVLLEEIVRITR